MFRPFLILLLALVAGLAAGQSRVLRAGDQIRLVSVENPTYCITRMLDFQGSVQVPGVGTISLVGLTPEAALVSIAGLAHLDPHELSLALVPARFRPIFVYGAVRQVGELSLFPDMRLGDALRLAEPTIAADLDLIETESETGDLLTVSFDENPLRPEGNPYLHSGDRIVLPLATQAAQVSVLGGVKQPGIVAYARGLTVKAAIDGAGGITNHGEGKDVRILRGGVEIKRLDIARSPEFELKRADTVVVPLSESRRFVTVVGEVKNGGLVAWKDGMTLAEAIQAAGGVTDKGDLEALRVQRMLGEDRFRKRMGMSKDKAFVLNANDVIQVPLRGSTPPEPTRTEPGPRRVVPPR